jgi:excisionase family DNA binding protein
MSIALDSPLLTREEAAAYLGLKPQTLAVWASVGRYGLRFVKVGQRARYRKADLDEFLERRTVTQTGEVE